ncbi:PE-PGRS family protein [Streptomyces sp. NBC_01221]|uniref:PE-PGRS family protein n=1 Tax=Streptomyces sp. NBC_01221 TaxID=2903782 RepID=UPI002251480E|nr:PE-PGRS family protein [Streptomyces sp. NBC_01221]MCX4788550.1 PE-PGRS family protein [Streptomyces sp. NBC_01221]
MRNVNADDLDQLAKLIDGKGGVGDKLAEAMTRASALGVSDRLAPIKPMRTWVTDTGPDMRTRATKVRAETLFERGHRETYSDWLARIEAHYLAKVPGLSKFGEKEIEDFLNNVSDVTTGIKIGGVTVFSGLGVGNILLKNSWYNGKLRSAVDAGRFGSRAQRISPGILRSLAAPGSWLPGQLAGQASSRSALYRALSRIPFTGTREASLFSTGWDAARGLPIMRSPFVSKAINFYVGSDAVAMRYGGVTHSGAFATRAANASLFRAWRSASYFQKLSNARPSIIAAGKTASPFLKGLGAAGKTAGFIRGAGVASSALATGVSLANVVAQGNPRDAFKEKGAGYVADVAEVGFNASLTAAMIAPNPVTIGLTVGFGAVYAGAKVVEHWPEIKENFGKAADWAGSKAAKVGSDIANGAKSLAKKANPMNWF